MLLQTMETLEVILPALVNSVPNEEPAVVKLLSDVTDTIVNNVCRFSLKMQVKKYLKEQMMFREHFPIVCCNRN